MDALNLIKPLLLTTGELCCMGTYYSMKSFVISFRKTMPYIVAKMERIPIYNITQKYYSNR